MAYSAKYRLKKPFCLSRLHPPPSQRNPRIATLSLAATQLDFDSFSDQRFTLLMGMLLRERSEAERPYNALRISGSKAGSVHFHTNQIVSGIINFGSRIRTFPSGRVRSVVFFSGQCCECLHAAIKSSTD